MKLDMMPAVLLDTSNGMSRCAISDWMLQRRQIECVGDIDSESAYSIILQLRYLAAQDAATEISLYINSPGGEIDSGLAIYDVMEAIACPVRTVCVGMAASMAALLFASGAKRDILPHARVMIHDPLMPHTGGCALKLDTVAKRLMDTRKTLAAILAGHTGRTLEEVYEKTGRETYFSAMEAVQWGLADNIITTI